LSKIEESRKRMARSYWIVYSQGLTL